MSLYPTAPLTIGQTIDAGFRAYRRVLKTMLPASFAVGLLSQLPEMLRPFVAAPEGGFSFSLALGLALAVLLWLYVYLSFYNGWIAALDAVLQGRAAPALGEVFSRGMSTAGTTLLGGLLYALATLAGLVLLVIPGLWASMALVFFWYFIVLENLGAADSLSASRQLVKGHWWRVCAVFTVAGLIYFIAVAVFASVIGVIFGLTAIHGGGVEAVKNPPPNLSLGMAAVQVIASTLLLPLWNAVSLVLYRDLKIRKSGADLAARAAAL